MGQRGLIVLEQEQTQLYTHWHSELCLPDAVRFGLTQDFAVFTTAYNSEEFTTAYNSEEFTISASGTTYKRGPWAELIVDGRVSPDA